MKCFFLDKFSEKNEKKINKKMRFDEWGIKERENLIFTILINYFVTKRMKWEEYGREDE